MKKISFLSIFIIVMLTACGPTEQDAKKLGFSSVKEMERIQKEGFANKADWVKNENDKRKEAARKKEEELKKQEAERLAALPKAALKCISKQGTPLEFYMAKGNGIYSEGKNDNLKLIDKLKITPMEIKFEEFQGWGFTKEFTINRSSLTLNTIHKGPSLDKPKEIIVWGIYDYRCELLTNVDPEAVLEQAKERIKLEKDEIKKKKQIEEENLLKSRKF